MSFSVMAREVSTEEASSFLQNWYANWDLAPNANPVGDEATNWLAEHVSTSDELLMTFRNPVKSKADLLAMQAQLRAMQMVSLHEMNLVKKLGPSTFRFIVTFVTRSERLNTDFNGTTIIDVRFDESEEELKIKRYVVRVMAPVTANPTFELQGTNLNSDILL